MIITVVGLGVIGGSFVKALKGKGYDVYGVDCDQQTLEMAKAEGCIIEGYLDGHQIISQSDLTIICLYPSKVLDFISEHTFKKGSIVIWKCRNCGHIVIGTEAPKICPICKHPQSFFEIKAENY